MKPNNAEGIKRKESSPFKNQDAGKFDALRAMLIRPGLELTPKEKVIVKSEGDPELLQFFPGGTVMLADEIQPMGSQTQLTTASALMSNNPYRVNPVEETLDTNQHKSKESNFSSKAPKINTKDITIEKSVTSFETFEKTKSKTSPEAKEETKGSGERLKLDRSVNSLQAMVQLELPKRSLSTLKIRNKHASPTKNSKSSHDKHCGSNPKVIAFHEKRHSSNRKTSTPYRQGSSSKTRVNSKTKNKRTSEKSKRKVTHN